jgi:hypothetical protein
MTSLKANSPAAYGDVKFVLDMAIKQPGLLYECTDSGRAIYFRQRCNRYRNLLRTMQAELMTLTPGVRAQTAYDVLVIRQIGAEGKASSSGNTLRFDHEALTGILRNPDGSVIEIPETFHLFDE